jgi:DNA-binding HxlR family transcriptional regulator
VPEVVRSGYPSSVSSKTEPARFTGPRDCAIADALELVGERWSLLVLRELALGVHRFNEIRQNTGAPRETLAARLHKLEEAGIIDRRPYSERPPRDEYVLTDAGRALVPVLRSLRKWGEQHASARRG